MSAPPELQPSELLALRAAAKHKIRTLRQHLASLQAAHDELCDAYAELEAQLHANTRLVRAAEAELRLAAQAGHDVGAARRVAAARDVGRLLGGRMEEAGRRLEVVGGCMVEVAGGLVELKCVLRGLRG